mmetsp:Transcript_13254/g.20106  ORF Transcript_13254/g.20106 Transcript_13254/m.20106 type:complete len:137 (+) Transcript_13254:151-561(+)
MTLEASFNVRHDAVILVFASSRTKCWVLQQQSTTSNGRPAVDISQNKDETRKHEAILLACTAVHGMDSHAKGKRSSSLMEQGRYRTVLGHPSTVTASTDLHALQLTQDGDLTCAPPHDTFLCLAAWLISEHNSDGL